MEELMLTYREENGIYYPDLQQREGEGNPRNLGKYGMLAARYLRENEPERYRTLMRFGKLTEKMREVDEEANDLLDLLMKKYLKSHKPKDPRSTMEMWRIREQGMMQAEEIVLNQIVYANH